MSNPRLELQKLERQADQVLVVGHLAASRSSNGTFSPSEATRLFQSLRVPVPSNVSRVLADLRRSRLIVQDSPGRYALSPAGEEHLSSRVSLRLADVDVHRSSETFFGSQTHHTIPPELAPSAFAASIGAFLERHAFERNVFGICRFPRDDVDDPMSAALDAVRDGLMPYGLEFHLASDRAVASELWANVAASLWASGLGVAILEDVLGEGINKNVLIEVGAMLITGRRCALLRDRSVDGMPTDLVGHIYKPVDLRDPATVSGAIDDWCSNDLGLGRVT